MGKAKPFTPNWASPPGETIRDILKKRGWYQSYFAFYMGLSHKEVSDLIAGKIPITPSLALDLSQVLGSSAAFWLKRESQYREDLKRLKQEKEGEV